MHSVWREVNKKRVPTPIVKRRITASVIVGMDTPLLALALSLHSDESDIPRKELKDFKSFDKLKELYEKEREFFEFIKLVTGEKRPGIDYMQMYRKLKSPDEIQQVLLKQKEYLRERWNELLNELNENERTQRESVETGLRYHIYDFMSLEELVEDIERGKDKHGKAVDLLKKENNSVAWKKFNLGKLLKDMVEHQKDLAAERETLCAREHGGMTVTQDVLEDWEKIGSIMITTYDCKMIKLVSVKPHNLIFVNSIPVKSTTGKMVKQLDFSEINYWNDDKTTDSEPFKWKEVVEMNSDRPDICFTDPEYIRDRLELKWSRVTSPVFKNAIETVLYHLPTPGSETWSDAKARFENMQIKGRFFSA
jgi:hypothetical protein